MTSIGKAAFRYCTKLATVTFESTSKLKTIEANVFGNCTILTSIAIPASVTSIGDFAFGGCGLESITLHCTTMIPFADGLFQNHSPQSIYVPAGLVAAYKNANGWKGYADKIQAIPS